MRTTHAFSFTAIFKESVLLHFKPGRHYKMSRIKRIKGNLTPRWNLICVKMFNVTLPSFVYGTLQDNGIPNVK